MTPYACPRRDCPLPHLDPAPRAAVDALPLAVREAITRAWCRNSRVPDARGCVEALLWHVVNHDRRSRRDSSQEERVRQPKLPRVVQSPPRGSR